MQGCTTPLGCTLGAWLQAHLIVAWSLTLLAGIIIVAALIYAARCIKESWEEAKEDQRLQQERRNEWKTFQHRIQSTIRKGEEWDVDVSRLKASAQRLTLARKAERAIEHEKALFALPIPFVSVLFVLTTWIPTLGLFIALCVVLLFSVVWWIYHGIKWRRYRWFFNVLYEAEMSDTATGESIG